MRWRLALTALTATSLLAACGGGGDGLEADGGPAVSINFGPSTTQGPKDTAPPRTVNVLVDARADGIKAAFNSYFPNAVRLRPGDTVTFSSIFQGEPHSVTFGKLVDTGLPIALRQPPAAPEPPDLAKIPQLVPRGPGDAIQAAAQPCYLQAGDPPPTDPCPDGQQVQPVFNGTHTFYNSGFLQDGDVFKVKIADDTKPGVYRFFCNLHRAQMSGELTVAKAKTKGDTAADVAANGRKQLADVVKRLTPAYENLTRGVMPPFIPAAGSADVLVGSLDPAIPTAVLVDFGPSRVSVPVGGSVTWTMVGRHTVSFNSSEGLRLPINVEADGSVHVNAASLEPAGGPGPPPPPPGAAGPPTGPTTTTIPRAITPTVVDGGEWDGTGYRSSGFYISNVRNLLAYRLTFTKPGSYPYICLIHPEMKGAVNVG